MSDSFRKLVYSSCLIACLALAAHGVAALPTLLRGTAVAVHTADEVLFETVEGGLVSK